MKGISDYTVVYDISSNSERKKIEKVLKGVGFRIQKSVFECRMNRRIKEELIKKLNSLDIQTGFVKIYRLEYSWKNCVIGKQKKKSIDDDPAFIV